MNLRRDAALGEIARGVTRALRIVGEREHVVALGHRDRGPVGIRLSIAIEQFVEGNRRFGEIEDHWVFLMTRLRSLSTVTRQPAPTTVVAPLSRTMTGPSTVSPGSSSAR